jgi:hypothetical protein
MKNILYLFAIAGMFSDAYAQNQIPKITNKNITINTIDNKIEIDFDVIDTDNQDLDIQCRIYNISPSNKYEEIIPQLINGDIGFPVKQGSNKHISIYFDLAANQSKLMVTLSAYDRESLDVKALLAQVSPEKLKEHLIQIEGKRNTSDPSFYNTARNYITNQTEIYLPVKTLQVTSPLYTCINYESTKIGNDNPSNIIIMDAHYDSAPVSPGADDNGSGVVGVLEAIRVLSEYSFKKSIRFLYFDLEELGLIGSNIYATNQLDKRDSIKGVINFEMIGYYTEAPNSQVFPNGFNVLFPEAYNLVVANNNKGDFITNVGCTNSAYLKNAFELNAKTYVPDLKVISLEAFGTGTITPDLRRSDHAIFWDKNIPAVMITDGANFRNKNYHTAKDSIGYLNFDFMANVVRAAIATMIDWGEIEHGTTIEIPVDLSTTTSNFTSNQFYAYCLNNQILIKSNLDRGNVRFELFDVTGNSICTESLSLNTANLTTLNCRYLKPGIYFLTTMFENDRQTQKIFVNAY